MGWIMLLMGVGLVWSAIERMESGEPSAVHQPISHQLFASAPGNFILGLILGFIGLAILGGS